MGERSLFYDRDGNPMTADEWALRFEDYEGRIVGKTEIGPYEVSTMWLGIDQSWGMGGPPLPFETMVFCAGEQDGHEFDCIRYATEADARAGHDELVTLIRATIQTAEDMLAEQDQPARKDGCD